MHVVRVHVCASVNLCATYKHAYLYEFIRAEHMSCRLILSKILYFFALNPLNNARGA